MISSPQKMISTSSNKQGNRDRCSIIFALAFTLFSPLSDLFSSLFALLLSLPLSLPIFVAACPLPSLSSTHLKTKAAGRFKNPTGLWNSYAEPAAALLIDFDPRFFPSKPLFPHATDKTKSTRQPHNNNPPSSTATIYTLWPFIYEIIMTKIMYQSLLP